MTDAPSFIQPVAASADRLEKVREKLSDYRAKKLELTDLEERLDRLKAELNALETKIIPDAFDEVGITSLSLSGEGNTPPATIELKPFYSANIAASWPPVQRAEGFDYLQSIGHGDLIKADVVVTFAKERHNDALDFAARARDAGLQVALKENVHPQTLTAWLRDQVENRNFLPQLDKIGGTVGRVARIKMED